MKFAGSDGDPGRSDVRKRESRGVDGGGGGGDGLTRLAAALQESAVNTTRMNKQVHIFDLRCAPRREKLRGWLLS